MRKDDKGVRKAVKRLIIVFAFILAFCILFSACEEAASSPSVSKTATPALTPKPTPTVTPEPTNEEEIYKNYIDEVHAYLQEYYSWEIEEANKYSVKVDDTRYYLDTSMFLDVYPLEFPLYRLKDGDPWPEYLGTTGFAFQVFNGYIYIKSDPFQEDWPDGTLTRVVNLKDLSITQAGRDIDIFIPKEGNKVFYTRSAITSLLLTLR